MFAFFSTIHTAMRAYIYTRRGLLLGCTIYGVFYKKIAVRARTTTTTGRKSIIKRLYVYLEDVFRQIETRKRVKCML